MYARSRIRHTPSSARSKRPFLGSACLERVSACASSCCGRGYGHSLHAAFPFLLPCSSRPREKETHWPLLSPYHKRCRQGREPPFAVVIIIIIVTITVIAAVSSAILWGWSQVRNVVLFVSAVWIIDRGMYVLAVARTWATLRLPRH